MFQAINSIIIALYFPLFLLLLYAIYRIIKENTIIGRYTFLVILFCFAWRVFCFAHSSRYACFIIFLAVLSLSYSHFFFRSRKERILLLSLMFVTCVVQAIKSFSGMRNNYIFDIQECLSVYNKDKSFFLIDSKEYNRFNCIDENNCFIYIYNEYDFNSLIKPFSIGSKDLYIAGYFPNNHKVSDNPSITSFSAFHAHNKCFMINKVNASKIQKNTWNTQKENQLFNGDMESYIEGNRIKQKFPNWINDGCLFYVKDNLRIPDHKVISETWRKYPNKDYPFIYSEEDNPIDGYYSLHVLFTKTHQCEIYLMNYLPAKKGVLSLSIKVIDQETPLFLSKYQCTNEGVYLTPSSPVKYYFMFNDNKIHRLQIPFYDEDILGDSMVFFLKGSNAEIIIDNVSYNFFETQ